MKRKFNFKPLPMLIAALVLADHFEKEKQAFVAEEPHRQDPFIANFRDDPQNVSRYWPNLVLKPIGEKLRTTTKPC